MYLNVLDVKLLLQIIKKIMLKEVLFRKYKKKNKKIIYS